ncbi:unnamed protein product [Ectocarpus sp. 8 AP-2014]
MVAWKNADAKSAKSGMTNTTTSGSKATRSGPSSPNEGVALYNLRLGVCFLPSVAGWKMSTLDLPADPIFHSPEFFPHSKSHQIRMVQRRHHGAMVTGGAANAESQDRGMHTTANGMCC